MEALGKRNKEIGCKHHIIYVCSEINKFISLTSLVYKQIKNPL